MKSPTEWAADLSRLAGGGGAPAQVRPANVWAQQLLADCKRAGEVAAVEGNQPLTDDDWVNLVAGVVLEIQHEASGVYNC